MATRELFALPTLFKKASTGKDLQWRIWVEDDTIYEEYGQIGGKLQTTPGTKCEGKNIGRTNETTADEQAQAEARSKWEKKLKGHNYTETLKDAQAGRASSMVEGGILPMLAHKFSEHGDKLKYPCAAQKKYDGHRMLSIIDTEGRCTLWSRTRKPINSLPHIVKALENLGIKNVILDGEAYNHDYRTKFEELTHFIRQETPAPGYEIVEYHVYDCAMAGGFGERLEYLKGILGPKGKEPIKLVETRIVNDEDELMLAFEDFLAQGYEGAIARNLDSQYVNKRSKDLLKIKKFDDSEYRCVRVEEGKGKMSGHAVFVCVTVDGTEFKAKMKGDHDALVQYFDKPELVVGKMVTIKYQGLTNKNGVPRFPVALRIRKDV